MFIYEFWPKCTLFVANLLRRRCRVVRPRGDTMHKKNAGVCIAQTLFDCVDRDEIKERIFNYLIYTQARTIIILMLHSASAAGHFPTVDQWECFLFGVNAVTRPLTRVFTSHRPCIPLIKHWVARFRQEVVKSLSSKLERFAHRGVVAYVSTHKTALLYRMFDSQFSPPAVGKLFSEWVIFPSSWFLCSFISHAKYMSVFSIWIIIIHCHALLRRGVCLFLFYN